MSLDSPSAGTEPGPFPRGPAGLLVAAVAWLVTLAVLVVAAVLSPAAIRFSPR